MIKWTTALIFFNLFISPALFAVEVEGEVVVRDNKFQPKLARVSLKNLKTETQLDGENFKIVHAKKDSPIGLDENFEDKETLLRARNVYYHLEIARDYFINKLDSGHVKSLPPLVIRVDISNSFNHVGHFNNDKLRPEFNNALSVPPSGMDRLPKYEPWGHEIWFRPPQVDSIDNIVALTTDQLSLNGELKLELYQNTLEDSAARVVQEAAYYESFQYVDYQYHLIKFAVLVGALDVLPHIIGQAAKLTKKTYYLDTAMIPEIIYHEFTHIALSDLIDIGVSTPVVEGYANFFAGAIVGHHKLAAKISIYAKGISEVNGKSNEKYNETLERSKYAHSDFVFALLWKIRESFDTNFAEKMVFNSTKYLGDSPNIKNNLVEALIKSAEELVPEKRISNRIKILRITHDFGI